MSTEAKAHWASLEATLDEAKKTGKPVTSDLVRYNVYERFKKTHAPVAECRWTLVDGAGGTGSGNSTGSRWGTVTMEMWSSILGGDD